MSEAPAWTEPLRASPTQPAPAGPRTLVVDARRLYGSGIGRYVRELVPRIVADGAFTHCVLVGDPAELVPWRDRVLPEAHIVPLPYGRYSLRAQWAWWRGVARSVAPGPCVTWFPHLDAPVLGLPAPAVVTVHDLIPLQVPGSTAWWRRALLPLVLQRVTGPAARIICVSQATADAVLARRPTLRARLRVVPNGGAEIADRPVVANATVPAAPYLLCVANRKPHKNLALAVRVLAARRAVQPTLRLVLVGEHFPTWAATQALAAQLGVSEALVDLGVVDDATLRALYAQCEALLAPSRLEGFGLPVVEALACGAPVLAADLPWARALGGTAAVYADPDDPAPWAAALEALAQDATLRAVRIAAGVQHAQAFTWTRCAEQTRAVLLEALHTAR